MLQPSSATRREPKETEGHSQSKANGFSKTAGTTIPREYFRDTRQLNLPTSDAVAPISRTPQEKPNFRYSKARRRRSSCPAASREPWPGGVQMLRRLQVKKLCKSLAFQVAKSRSHPNTGPRIWSIYGCCMRNRNHTLGYRLHIWVLGPLGYFRLQSSLGLWSRRAAINKHNNNNGNNHGNHMMGSRPCIILEGELRLVFYGSEAHGSRSLLKRFSISTRAE